MSPAGQFIVGSFLGESQYNAVIGEKRREDKQQSKAVIAKPLEADLRSGSDVITNKLLFNLCGHQSHP